VLHLKKFYNHPNLTYLAFAILHVSNVILGLYIVILHSKRIFSI